MEDLDIILCQGLVSKENSMAKIKKILSNYKIQFETNQNILELEVKEVELPLKCPLSLRRIKTPTRGCNCEHIQCFDLESYLSLNYKANSWKCPICNKNAEVKDLKVDAYLIEILQTTMRMSEVEKVLIDLSAQWKIRKPKKPKLIDLTSAADQDYEIIHSIANLDLD